MGALHPFPDARAARLAGALLNRHSPQEIADAVEILIDVLDTLGGDPDLEEGGDNEPNNGDDKDVAWPEWDRLNAKDKRAGFERPTLTAGNGCHAMTEDDEDDDPAGQCDEDGINTGPPVGVGPGCVISDDDFAETGPIPSYGIDQTFMLNNPNYPGIDPAPDFMPSSEALR